MYVKVVLQRQKKFLVGLSFQFQNMFQGSSSVSSRRSDLAFVFDLWSFPKDVLGPTMDRGSYFAIDYHPKDNPKARSWL